MKCADGELTVTVTWRLPPCGGSGLKFYGTVTGYSETSLPPCGGSGLKSNLSFSQNSQGDVSLRVEGVD